MKNAIITVSVLAIVSMITWLTPVFSPPVLASPVQLFGREPKKEDKTRLLTGKVLDATDSPLPNAVVYLTNTQTRSIKTYIVGPEGTYRFPGLQPGVDYEVYAQYEKRRSSTKTVSQFDDRAEVYVPLKISAKAESN